MSGTHIILGVIVAALWGINFVAIKFSYETFTPFTLLVVRFFLTIIPLILFVPLPKTPWRQLAALAIFMWLGQFCFVFYAIYNGLSPGLASVLMQLQVLLTTLLSVVIYKSSLNRYNIIGLALAAAGILSIAMQLMHSITVIAYVCVIMSAVCISIGNLLMKTVPGENLLSLVSWSTLIAFFPILGLALYHDGIDAMCYQFQHITLTSGSAIFYTTYASSLLGYYLWGYLMRYYPASTVAPFALLVPIFGMSSSTLILNEHFSWGNIGASIVVMGGLIVNYSGRFYQHKKKPSTLTVPTIKNLSSLGSSRNP